MSDVNLDDLRREYTFRLTPESRCESCRHAAPVVGKIATLEARCALLGINIANVRKSKCPGWQTAWGGAR